MWTKQLLAFTLLFALTGTRMARAQWVQTNGPSSGNVYCLANIGSQLFCGMATGIFVSTDKGDSWTPMNSGLKDVGVQTLVVDGTTLFAGTSKGGVYRSMDSAKTWSAINSGLSVLDVQSLWVSGTSLFAGTSNGIFVSTTNGASWSSAHTGIPNSTRVDAFVSYYSLLFAGTSNGIFRSSDQGATWTPSNTGLTNIDVRCLAATEHEQPHNALFAGTFGGGVFRSSDSGRSWAPWNQGLTQMEVRTFSQIGDLLFAGAGYKFFDLSDSIWNESDNGLTFTSTTWVYAILPVLDSFSSTEDVLYAATGNGVRQSFDHGNTWPFQSGVHLTIYGGGALATIGSNVFLGGDSTFYSTDNGTNWQERNQLSSIECFSLQGSDLLAGTYRGEIVRTTDSGRSWSHDPTFGGNAILSFGTIGNVTIAGTGDQLLSSVAGSRTWGTIRACSEARSFAAIDTVLFAASFDGLERNQSPQELYGAQDYGASWKQVLLTGFDPYRGMVTAIGSVLFAGWGDTVVRSTDLGMTWESASNGLPSYFDLWSFAVDGNALFAIGDIGGVYLSTDNGGHWQGVNDGLEDSTATAFAFNDTFAFVATKLGVYRRSLSELFTVSNAGARNEPQPQEIIRSYPNPFSQSTTISFTSDACGYADISIVNTLGTEIAHLYSGDLAAGEHSFEWSAAKMTAPPGVYECVVRRNGTDERSAMATLRIIVTP